MTEGLDQLLRRIENEVAEIQKIRDLALKRWQKALRDEDYLGRVAFDLHSFYQGVEWIWSCLQFGFKDLKSFVKNQASLMLMARIEKYEAENKRFEAKYHMPFKSFQAKVEGLQNEEVFSEDDDYLDWRYAKEAIDRLVRQKQELEYA